MFETKQVIAAVLLIAVALSTVGYADATFGTSVTTVNVSISANLSNPPTIPKRTTWATSITNGLTLSGLGNLQENDELRIRVELVVDRTLAESVRNIIVVIDNNDVGSNKGQGDNSYTTADTILTLNKPWSEFNYTVQNGDSEKSWNVYVIIMAGDKTVSSGTFTIIGSVIAFTPSSS